MRRIHSGKWAPKEETGRDAPFLFCGHSNPPRVPPLHRGQNSSRRNQQATAITVWTSLSSPHSTFLPHTDFCRGTFRALLFSARIERFVTSHVRVLPIVSTLSSLFVRGNDTTMSCQQNNRARHKKHKTRRAFFCLPDLRNNRE